MQILLLQETQEATEVTTRNKKYEEVCSQLYYFSTLGIKINIKFQLLKNRIGNENYVTRGMQTFNNAQKNKDVQVSAPAVKEASTMATIWDVS